MEAIETITVTSDIDPEIEVTVRIFPDECPCDPRKEWDNLGTMVFSEHRRFALGDEQTGNGGEFLRELCSRADPEFDRQVEYWEDGEGWEMICEKESAEKERRCREALKPLEAKIQAEIDQLIARNYDPFLGCNMGTCGLGEKIEEVRRHYGAEADQISLKVRHELSVSELNASISASDERIDALVEEVLEEHYVMLPLYLYEHGGITVRSGSPCRCWDEGQAGLIYVSKARIRDEYGDTSDETIKKVVNYLEGEVATYAQYCEGAVYGYAVEDENQEDRDSCWGFFGYEYAKEEALQAAKHVLETLEKEKAAEAADDSGTRMAA